MSRINCFALAVIICLSSGIAGSPKAYAQNQEMNAEKVVAEHLKSLGKPEVLAGIKSRYFQGVSSVQFIQGATGNLTGGFVFASDGSKVGIASQYNDTKYPMDRFAYDGKDVTVNHITPGQRSPLGDFIFRYNGFVKEGLFGGTLSVSWPLLDIQKTQPSLKYSQSKVEGHLMHVLEYRPKRNWGEMKVKLYFDETFHHVKTEYTIRIKSDMTSLPSVSAGRVPDSAVAPTQQGAQQRSIDGAARPTIMDAQADSIYTLVEKFDKFREVGGVTLPFSYTIDYSVEGTGTAFIGRWVMRSDGTFKNNVQIGPEFFRAQE